MDAGYLKPGAGCTKISAGCKNYRSKLDHDICISAKAFRGELL